MVAGPRVGGHPDAAHLSGGPARRESSVRRLRHYQIQLPVHPARKPDGPPHRPDLARPVPGERTPEVRRVAGYRRAPLYLHRQGQRPVDVLRQSVDQEGGDRLPRSVGRIRRGVQFSGLAQLGLHVAGGFRHRTEFRWQRIRLGGQHRSPLRHAVARRTEAAPGQQRARAARRVVQPRRRAPPLLLVEQRGRTGAGRLAHLLSHAIHRQPWLHPDRHLAGELRRTRPERGRQPHAGSGIAIHPRFARAVHGRLPSAHALGHRALLELG